MVSVEFRPLRPTNTFRNGRHLRRPATKPGALGLYDLRESWAAELRDPFDNLNVFLPLGSLRDFAAERGQTFAELQYSVEDILYDEVMLRLAQAVLPALDRPHEVSRLYLDHLFLTVRDHIVTTYGVFSANTRVEQRGLSSRQLRRALEYIEANLGKDVSLADMANACAASISSLTRGFKVALNVSPHQWVLGRRIALAQRLMSDGNKPLSEIAVACGFADQSHLARVFTHRIGTSPALWRRSIFR